MLIKGMIITKKSNSTPMTCNNKKSITKVNTSAVGGERTLALCLLLRLGNRDGRTLGVVEAVHGAQLHDHVQAISEDQHHEKRCEEPHPDTRSEETSTVTGVRENPSQPHESPGSVT